MIIYQKIFYALIGLIFIFLSGVLAINYFVDPANQFFHSRAFENKVAELLLSKKEVMIRSNYNARFLKKIILSKLIKQPDVLILGSSRVMSISHDLFKTDSFYNAWVPLGATIQDDAIFYYLYQKRGWKPKTVLICLDTWLLARNNGKEAWKSLLPEFFAAKRFFLNDPNESSMYYEKLSGNFDRYSQLLSIDYLTTSFKKIKEYYNDKRNNIVLEDFLLTTNRDVCTTCEIDYPDGSRLESKKKDLTTAQEADLKGKKAFAHLKFDNSYTELDSEYKNFFEKFIGYLVAQNINVIFYLPPYEPAAFDEIIKDPNYKMIIFSEQYFRAIASRYHLRVIGSYNPNILGLQAADFSDEMHLKKEGIQKIFNKFNSV